MAKENSELYDSRIPWIDAVRGVAIFLVVIGHSIVVSVPLQEWGNVWWGLFSYIYAFHMALFFFISGCVFNYDRYINKPLDFLKRRLKTLIVPYLFFTIFGLLFFSLLTRQNLFLQESIYSFIRDIITAKSPGQTADWLWFLPSLFIVAMLYYWISRYLFPKRVVSLIIVLFIIGLVGAFIIHINPLMALLYYGIGHLFMKFSDTIIGDKLLPLAILFSGIFLLVGGSNSNEMWNPTNIQSYLILTGTAFSGILGTTLLVKWFYSRKLHSIILEFLGKNSIIIYIIHGFILAIFTTYFIFIVKSASIFILSVITILACIPFVYIIKRFVPFIIGK